jgi:hypothetical protein
MDNQPWLATIDLLRGYQKTQIGCAVASLSIADHLAARPLSLEALVEKTGANPDGLRRLLRGAASLGLVRAESDDLFASTPMLETLRSDAPASLRAVAIMQGSPNHWRPWGRLIDAVRTGQAQAVAALGRSAFDYLAANPDEASFFAKAMQSTSEFVQAEVVRLLDTNGVATAADIGGANGALVCALIAANPTLKGIVFDLPHAVDGATAFIKAKGLADRVEAIGGDFFESVPAAGLYLLKFILHDWDDAACVKILTKVRRAMADDGRIAIVELRLGPMGEAGPAPLVDLTMLTLTGGRERTPDEYSKLLASTGLKLASVKETNSPFSIFEAVPA